MTRSFAFGANRGGASGEKKHRCKHFLGAMAGPMAAGRKDPGAQEWQTLSQGMLHSGLSEGTVSAIPSCSWVRAAA